MGYPVMTFAEAWERELAEGRRPMVVVLCGSTRYWRTFQEASLRETIDGRIILSIGAARAADDGDKSFGGYMPEAEFDAIKERLDRLHLEKVGLADEALILNVDDYIGDSTRRELAHARALGKRIRWWEYPSAHAWPGEGPR